MDLTDLVSPRGVRFRCYHSIAPMVWDTIWLPPVSVLAPLAVRVSELLLFCVNLKSARRVSCLANCLPLGTHLFTFHN